MMFELTPFKSNNSEEDYQKKIDFAIKVLQSIPQDCEIELSYSGGKDGRHIF